MMRARPTPGVHTMLSLSRVAMALAMLAACCAQAADKPKEASFGKGKAAGAFLTKEQLRSCLNQQSGVAQLDATVLKEQAALTELKAEIARRADSLKEQLAALDRSSEAAVVDYNAQAEARDKMIDNYQARVTASNTGVESAKVRRQAFAAACDNRRYFEEDEIAIKKGR